MAEAGYTGYAIVEQDMYPAAFDRPLPIARRTHAYLSELGLASRRRLSAPTWQARRAPPVRPSAPATSPALRRRPGRMTDDDGRIVVVTYPAFDADDPHTGGVLRAAGFEVRLEPRVAERRPDEVLAFMADATAGVVSTDPFDRDVLVGCPRLRVLARVGVGVDTIDLDAATEAGVAVTTTPESTPPRSPTTRSR